MSTFDRGSNLGRRASHLKVGVDLECVIVHTGKDIHPERKRLSTLAFYKEDKGTAEFFAEWPEDSDRPTELLFGGTIEAIEKAEGYDPDDSAPWVWNVQEDIFTEDLTWEGILSKVSEFNI